MKPTNKRRLPPKFETLREAAERTSKLVAILRNRETLEAAGIAYRLSHCGEQQQCHSAACPRCNRRFRKRLYRQVLKAVPPDAQFLAVSLIPASSRVEVEELATFDLKTWVNSRQRGIARALPPEALFIGGVDLSLNTFENSDQHWCLHIYGFVVLPPSYDVEKRSVRDRIRAALERHCPALVDRDGGGVPLKVGARERDVFEKKFLYAHKSVFYRRSRYGYVKRKTNRRSTNVDRQPLRSPELPKAALFLDRFPLGERLLLKGFRRYGLRGGIGQFTLRNEVTW